MASALMITGDKALKRKLMALEDKVQERVMRGALGQALKPVQIAAKAKVVSKRIRRLIGKKAGIARRGRLKGEAYGLVRVRSASKLKATRGMTIRLGGKDVDFGAVGTLLEYGTKHMRPRPFMRPALNEQRSAALSILRRDAWQRMQAQVAKMKGMR